VDEIINIQAKDGKAKAYQVKQVRTIVVKHQLGVPMLIKYELIIYWSEEDQSFVVEVPELPGCMADGGTYEEAVMNAQTVIQEWIDTARESGRAAPQPKGRLMYA